MAASSRLKIGLVGAGAIGTAIAGRLAAAGQAVSVVARGRRRESILRDGLRFREDGKRGAVRVPVVEMQQLADRDVIIVATKTTALPALLRDLAAVVSRDALLMAAVNGLPWWYFQGEGPLSGTVLRSVDPSGEMSRLFEPERLIGCVVYSRASMDDGGEVEILGRQRLKVGAVGQGRLPPTLIEQLTEAGIVVSVEDNIRRAVWAKLVRNASTNLVSGLTNATLEQISRDGELLDIVRGIAGEVIGLSERVGCASAVDLGEVVDEIGRAGPFVTSMLQDIRAGRAPELDTLATAPLEVAELVGHQMPVLRQTASLLRSRLRYAT